MNKVASIPTIGPEEVEVMATETRTNGTEITGIQNTNSTATFEDLIYKTRKTSNKYAGTPRNERYSSRHNF